MPAPLPIITLPSIAVDEAAAKEDQALLAGVADERLIAGYREAHAFITGLETNYGVFGSYIDEALANLNTVFCKALTRS